MKKLNKNSVITGIFALALAFGFAGPMTVLAAGPTMVNLGTAGNFVILSKAGISTTGTTAIVGDIGVSPIAASAITGFGLVLDSSGTFSKSALVTGKASAADYTAPTPSMLTTAVGDMETAYNDAAGRTNPTATELGAGNIGGMTLAPSLYKWSTDLLISTDVTLSGSASDVWIFQIAGNLEISSGKKVILNGGAQAKNIFWQVAGETTLGTTSVFNGTILDQTAIVLKTGAVLNGRALAQTQVTLDANTISSPVKIASPVKTTSTPPSPSAGSLKSQCVLAAVNVRNAAIKAARNTFISRRALSVKVINRAFSVAVGQKNVLARRTRKAAKSVFEKSISDAQNVFSDARNAAQDVHQQAIQSCQ